MDYQTGKALENIDAKLEFLISKLTEAEEKSKDKKSKEE